MSGMTELTPLETARQRARVVSGAVLLAVALLAALVAGVAVLELQHLPMRLNLIAAGLLGIAAGTLAEIGRERWTRR